jgi:hypothetical protein
MLLLAALFTLAIWYRVTSLEAFPEVDGDEAWFAMQFLRIVHGKPNFIDIPVPGDYSGTGVTQVAVFRPATATWTIKSLKPDGAPTVISFGSPSRDVPVPDDYDGDGKTDLAIYRPEVARWRVRCSSGTCLDQWFGADDIDIPTPGDYDGDGKADLALFRPANAGWQTRTSRQGHITSLASLGDSDEKRPPLPANRAGGVAPPSTAGRDRDTATR